MKKFFTSKPFLITALIVLCLAVVAVCLFLNWDRGTEFVPEPPQQSESASDWKENGGNTGGTDSAAATTPNPAQEQAAYPNYLKAHQPLLTDVRFKYGEHITVAGMARPFHAIDEMGHLIGGFDGLLPYGKEIDRCATEGNMFGAISYCNPKYTASLKKVLEVLQDEHAE